MRSVLLLIRDLWAKSGYVTWKLWVVWWVLMPVWANAQNGYAHLEDKGWQILHQMSIANPVLLQQSINFSLANVTWTFQEDKGFNALLNRLEQGQSIFQRINVLPGQFVMSASLKEGMEALLWVKKQTADGYSGTFNLLSTDIRPTELKSLDWLPEQAQVLLDIESDKPLMTHQWIYLVPFSKESMDILMQSQLRQASWQRQIHEGMSAWHKDDERLVYHLNAVEDKTALYVLKQRMIEKN